MFITLLVTTKTTYAFFAVTVFAALSLAISPLVGSADAVYSPAQPHATTSYNSVTNEVQLVWDYTTGAAPETCLLRADFWFYTNLNLKHDVEGKDNADPTHADYGTHTRVTGFIPQYYSVVSSSPTTIGAAEVIPCQGSTRINLDTIMSHPSNIDVNGNPHLDLEIFLSFYSTTPAGGYSTSGQYFIDEVFVFYTPTDVWRDEALAYACAGQNGNTLYIDQSGIHGNNGDNCNQYLELNSNQYVDISSSGVSTFGPHPSSTYPLLISTLETVVSRSGGGSCSDCTPPTLGLDSLGNLRVRGGITINGHSEDGGYFHTDYPMQYTTLGKTNHIILKYYENQGPQNIKLIQLGIGVKEIGTPISESQALIEVWIDDFASDIDNPLIKEIIVIDPDGIISNEFANVFLSTCSVSMSNNVKLSDSFEDKQSFYRNLVDSTCLSVSFGYSYDKVPQSWILSSNAIDHRRNTINNYFNDGLTVIDDSPIMEIIPEPSKYECKDPIQNVMTRNNCNFDNLILSEANRALAVLHNRTVN